MQSEIVRYNQFTYWVEGDDRTTIGDFDANQIKAFNHILTEKEIHIWIDGYENGWRVGRDAGELMKTNEIKKVLGIL